MNTPQDLKYAMTDEWVRVADDIVTVGVSDYAQDSLSDVVFFEAVVSVGDTLKAKQQIATLESVKAAADINAPVSGEVVEVNEGLASAPEVVNSDPYGKGWMLRIRMSNPEELDNLMDADSYDTYTDGRSH